MTDVHTRRVYAGEWLRGSDHRLVPDSYARRGLRMVLGLVIPAVVVALACVALTATASLAADEAAVSDEPPQAAAEQQALAFVRADRSVAALLSGTSAGVTARSWGGAPGQPEGFTFVFRWPAADAASVDAEWPLLHSDGGTPQPPYDPTTYRLRVRRVSALRVDVLAGGPRIIQVMPLDGETDFLLREQTWPPFSWAPRFTARPWMLTPVFAVIATLIALRAWTRSRAWNRRLPSMTRHDRQFIGRLLVLVFLLSGFAWQFYEGWFAATGPSLDTSGSSAGDLTALPLLLIPPALFVAGLLLELSAPPHRGAWGLLAVLAGAVSIFNLATALTGVTTNLNLMYYVLLAVLTLVSVPRAFATGKMGWSRSYAPRYG